MKQMKHMNWLAIGISIVIVGLIIWAIIAQVKESHLKDDPMLHELTATIKPLFEKKDYTGTLSMINDRDVLNEIGLYKGGKSFCINKQKIYLCLTDEQDEYYDKQILIFVLLHEIAHVLTRSIGHTEEFHEIFEALLKEATEQGIYDPSVAIPGDYCAHGDENDY
jgi:hypothetical protein